MFPHPMVRDGTCHSGGLVGQRRPQRGGWSYQWRYLKPWIPSPGPSVLQEPFQLTRLIDPYAGCRPSLGLIHYGKRRCPENKDFLRENFCETAFRLARRCSSDTNLWMDCFPYAWSLKRIPISSLLVPRIVLCGALSERL